MSIKFATDKNAPARGRKRFTINTEVFHRLSAIETRAEKLGFRFLLDDHLQSAIEHMIREAESELDSLEVEINEH